MSIKNTAENKKIRRLERALRKDRLPKYIDLVEWLKIRKHVNTVGAAMQLLQNGGVMADSHPLGKKIIDRPIPGGRLQTKAGKVETEKVEVLDKYVPARYRNAIKLKDGV